MEVKRNRLLVLFVAAMLLVSMLATGAFAAETDSAPELGCYNQGDVNGDGRIDSADAIYTLYCSLFGTELYPVTQNCDFNADTHVTHKDAIYLLYASLGLDTENYPLKGTIHQYYDPIWSWNEDFTVSGVVLKCNCGEAHEVAAEDVTVTTGTVTDATCVDNGVKEYVATLVFDDQTFTGTKEEITPVAGHVMEGTLTCTTGTKCANCDYAVEALGHTWVLDAENCVEATCSSNAVEAYKCSGCDATTTNELKGFVSHSFEFVEDQHVEGCQYQKLYRCSVCETEEAGEAFYQHTYTAALTTEATCSAEGLKTFTCACGDTYTEAVPVNGSHTWVEGETVEGVTTYTCECGESKTVIAVADTTATVKTEDLSNELQLENASLSLDADTLAGLEEGKEVVISVDEVDPAVTGLSEEEIAQLGGETVYDFTMSYTDETAISDFDGLITISMPYELQEGDDVECIDVWFINDDGTTEVVQGTYSNGYVTFTTDHFSYYTVTRLTPTQRCAKYGHVMVTNHKDATCTAAGHHVESCRRCGHKEKNDVLPMLGHTFEDTIVAATCTADGTIESICSVCRVKVSGVLPATGHNYVKDEEQSVVASCTSAGKEVYVCSGCGDSYTNESAQLEHQYEETEKKDADCTNKGHKKLKCKLCGDKQQKDESLPTGHDFKAENAVWTWAEDYSSATCTLVCSYDQGHTKTLKTAVTSETTVVANCTEAGAIVYTATASMNKVTYTDSKTQEVAAVGHQPGKDWATTAENHYRVCTVCEEKLEVTAHTFGEEKVTKEPTCVDTGKAVYACTVCAYEKSEVIPATGEHTFDEDGICTVCKYDLNACYHIMNKEVPIDLTKFNVCEGTKMWWMTCDCGANRYLDYTITCQNMTTDTKEEVIDGVTHTITTYTCADCGLAEVHDYCFRLLNEEDCLSGYEEFTRFVAKSGDEIVEIGGVYDTYQHYTDVLKETLDMTEKGMCGTMSIYTCACGERTDVSDECSWTYVSGETNADGVYVREYVCTVCETRRTEADKVEKDMETCACEETITYTFTNDGKEIYTFNNIYHFEDHFFEVTSAKLLGKTCEDGVVISGACSTCGATYQYTTDYHERVTITETDISDLGYCATAYRKSVCACGEYVDYTLIYGGETSCNWNHIANDQDGNTHYQCVNCGLKRKLAPTVYGEKDENCVCDWTQVITYMDAEDKVLFTFTNESQTTRHDYKQTGTLLGETCEDGVVITQTCVDCDYSYSWTSDYHETLRAERYDLAEYGLCGGYFETLQCACGQEGGRNYSYNCQWYHVSSTENGNIYACEVCGATRTQTYGEEKDINECLWNREDNVTFSKDGEELLSVSYTMYGTTHRWIYTMTLLNAEGTCDDGYRMTAKCDKCGEVENYGTDEGCYTRRVKYEVVSLDQLCGDLGVHTYSCACGKLTNVDVEQVDGEGCNYYNGYFDVTAGCYVYVCETCGVERLIPSKYVRAEDSCMVTHTESYIFRKDGEELLNIDTSEKYISHVWEYSYTMLGETCDDGFVVTRKCKLCGETENYGGPYYGCDNTWQTEVEILNKGIDMCGELQKRTYSCACGKNSSINYTWTFESCSYNNESWSDEEQCYIATCRKCGITRKYPESVRTDVDDCNYIRTTTYTYFDGDKELFSYDQINYYSSHKHVFTFTMLGETCEDGYVPNGTCVRCGETSNYGTYTYCTDWLTSVETLYEDDCGTLTREVRNCPCGSVNYYSSGENYEGHSFSYSGGMHVCTKCALTWTKTAELSEKDENCAGKRTEKYVVAKDGETLVEKTYESSYTNHRYIYEYELEGESCEDGYYRTKKCADCDYSGEAVHSTSEGSYTIAYHDLADYGMCGGYVSVYSCACGEHSSGYNGIYEMGCSYSWTGEIDPETGMEKRYCETCNTYFSYGSTSAVNRETCQTEYTWHVRAERDGQELFHLNGGYSYETHKYVVDSFEWTGETESCESGFRANMKCHYCDATTTYNSSYHNTYTTEYIDLTEKGACGENRYISYYSCACGYEQNVEWYYGCAMEYDSRYETDENGIQHYFEEHSCAECGLKRVYESYSIYDKAACKNTYYYNYTFFMGETQIAEYNIVEERESHIYVVDSFTLPEGSTSCNDGYTVTRKCVTCEKTTTESNSWHNTYLTGYHEVEGCGATVRYYSCVCGDEQNVNWDYSCDMDYSSWYETDENGISHRFEQYACAECGFTRLYEYYTFYNKAACKDEYFYGYTFTKGEEEIATYSWTEESAHHIYVVDSFTLPEGSTSCEDGYTVVQKCTVCGNTTTNTGSYHGRYAVERTDLADKGACGGYIIYNSCACGQSKSVDWDYDCTNMSYDNRYETDENGVQHYYNTYSCADCGFTRNYENYSVYAKDECKDKAYYVFEFLMGEEPLVKYDYVNESEHHVYVVESFTLPEGSTSCNDGYVVKQKCMYCDATTASSGSYHSTYVTEYIDVAEAGGCGGYIRKYQCACGYSANVEWDTDCADLTYDSRYETDENGIEHHYSENNCAECGFKSTGESYSYFDKANCQDVSYRKNAYYIGEKELTTYEHTSYSDHHIYIVESFEFAEGGTTCEDGVTVTMQCMNCDESYESNPSYHATYQFDYIDLSDKGCCGGYVSYYKCACGLEASVNYDYDCSNTEYDSWSNREADGYDHYYTQYSCTECDFISLRDSYSYYDKADCKQWNMYTYSFYKGEEVIASYEDNSYYAQHTYGDDVYALKEGSTTCDDGLLRTRTCETCGYVYESTYYGHGYNVLSSIDLANYNSVCGGKLNLVSCPCGMYTEYQLDDDNLCDLSSYYTDDWVENDIDSWQYQINGSISCYTDSYRYVCAVTDPQCKMQLRKSTYWVAEEGCVAKQYQTWQLGYDDVSDTYMEEVTIATGRTCTWHDYESEDLAATADDGSNTSGTKYTCSGCESFYYNQYWYDADDVHYKTVTEYVNNMDDGNNKRRYTVSAYEEVYDGQRYISNERNEYTYADGSEYWTDYTYTYDFTCCKRTRLYTDSNGESSTYESNFHNNSYTSETIEENTCTQYGSYKYWYVCTRCGHKSEEYTITTYPNGHYWRYNYSTGIYTCYYCDLENTNGSTGSVVFEDLTEEYGEGTNYVVGYYLYDDISFLNYVSIVLHDVGEDEDNEIILDVELTELTTEEDGITAISFSIEDTATAAAAAVEEAGYTGTYDVRFTFVPEDEEDTLDYAITFGSLLDEEETA